MTIGFALLEVARAGVVGGDIDGAQEGLRKGCIVAPLRWRHRVRDTRSALADGNKETARHSHFARDAMDAWSLVEWRHVAVGEHLKRVLDDGDVC